MTQRIIRFRAWDGIKMFYEVFHHLGFAGETLKEKAEIGINDTIAVTQKVYILMQFTGLFDKNGKEIYEGDIVRDGDGEERIVIWYLAGFYFKYLQNKGRDDALVDATKCEVIGNRYENPDLPHLQVVTPSLT